VSSAPEALQRLLELMARLRDPQHGCPWDLEQTFASIAPFTIEEAYEVADAIAREQPRELCGELGDLLFQVVFHARMAQERGWFDFAAVAEGITEKLTRRHPHIFAGAQLAPEDLVRVWEEQKAAERLAAAGSEAAPPGALAGVPQALPALTRALKLGRRGARVGFDWSTPEAVRDKVFEEIGEVDAALQAADASARHAALAEELGDLLFALVNWSRHLEIDPEEALRHANRKFERRFARMETLARERALPLQSLSAADWDALWTEAKLNGG
jgi:nucleoside triphosphate diphosphatase